MVGSQSIKRRQEAGEVTLLNWWLQGKLKNADSTKERLLQNLKKNYEIAWRRMWNSSFPPQLPVFKSYLQRESWLTGAFFPWIFPHIFYAYITYMYACICACIYTFLHKWNQCLCITCFISHVKLYFSHHSIWIHIFASYSFDRP